MPCKNITGMKAEEKKIDINRKEETRANEKCQEILRI